MGRSIETSYGALIPGSESPMKSGTGQVVS